MNCTWGNMQSPWLQGELSCWDALTFGAEIIKCRKNSFLFREGEDAVAMFVVAKGRFRITTYHEDGSEKQIYITETGAICGEEACIAETPYNVSALAIVDSEVYRISAMELQHRMEQEPMLTKRLLDFEVRKTYLFRQHIVSLSFEQASCRIAQTLLHIGQLYGKETPDGQCLAIKFTKNDIAGMVGTSRVTASSELSKMEQSGLLVKQNGYYIITDIKKMTQMAGL